MTTSNTSSRFLNTSELDFDSIKSSLKTYLSGQDQFTDYDFEGSNMSILLDVLSYNTHLMAHYLNMVGSEMFIDSAQTSEALASHAKSLNYVPSSKTSSRAIVDIQISPGDSPSYIEIPKNYKFTSSIDGVKHSFIVAEDIIVRPDENGDYIASNTTIYEGFPVTEYFTSNTTIQSTGLYKYNNRFIIQSENADITSLEVTVQNSVSDNTQRTFTRAESLFGLDSTSEVFFLHPYGENRYELSFGNGVLGKGLENGNLVIVKYRDTVGDEGNGAATFSKSTNIDSYSTISVTTVQVSKYGSPRESKEEIRVNAPRWFQTQYSAVTQSDYETLVKTQFPELEAVIAYGGEADKKYGKVIISAKPYGSSAALSESLKNRIKSFLVSKNITTEPLVYDPEYVYISVTSDVQYDNSITTLSSSEILSKVITAILGYNTSLLSDFGKDLRFSTLVNKIDQADESIISNETNLKMIKRLYPEVNVSISHSIKFGNPIKDHGGTYPDGYSRAIESSAFTYTHEDTDYTSYIADDGNGTLYLYTLNTSGDEIVLDSSIGEVDYSSGEVSFTLKIKGYESKISLYAIPSTDDIIVSDNKFLVIESDDMNITPSIVRQ